MLVALLSWIDENYLALARESFESFVFALSSFPFLSVLPFRSLVSLYGLPELDNKVKSPI